MYLGHSCIFYKKQNKTNSFVCLLPDMTNLSFYKLKKKKEWADIRYSNIILSLCRRVGLYYYYQYIDMY